MGVLGPKGRHRHTELLGTSRQKLAPHLGTHDADRVVQNPGVVRTTGDLGVAPLLFGRRTDDVHVFERDVEVVGYQHGEHREEALADLSLGALGVHPVVGLDLNLEVVNRALLAGHEDVREVLSIREFIGLRRECANTVGEPQTGADGQRRARDQKSLQDLATAKFGVKNGHTGLPPRDSFGQLPRRTAPLEGTNEDQGN